MTSQTLTSEINRISETLEKKSTGAWMRDYCLTRLAAIAADEDYDDETRHHASEALRAAL